MRENQRELEQLEDNFDETTGKQQKRLQTLEKISKTKSNIVEITNAIDYSKKTEYFRHPNIPQNISDEHVWNDAWYDGKRKRMGYVK